MQGVHYHVMKLQSKVGTDGNPTVVDPYDPEQFTRPVHLHRRRAHEKPTTGAGPTEPTASVDDKEREMLNAKRAERDAEREANRAMIAPSGGVETKKPVKKKRQKKVEDVYFDENDPKQRQRQKLRYEESRPWHLEDFDGKQVWVGTFEEPPSDMSVMFEIGTETEGFRMIPVEKWYKFVQTNRVNVMNIEQVEKHMAKKYKMPRWALGTHASNDEARHEELARRLAELRSEQRQEYSIDRDEPDYEYNDEFPDDDEGLIFGDQGDEEAKEIERKIFHHMREANLPAPGLKNGDKDWDAEEDKKRKLEKAERKRTKKLRKQLVKKERKNEYNSDSEHGEFDSSSEEDESEEERQREEDGKKQEEAQKAHSEPSGSSSKGTNTPSGRSEKKAPAKLGPSLKRPGSPDLSEMSGNESSRKKAKVNGGLL